MAKQKPNPSHLTTTLSRERRERAEQHHSPAKRSAERKPNLVQAISTKLKSPVGQSSRGTQLQASLVALCFSCECFSLPKGADARDNERSAKRAGGVRGVCAKGPSSAVWRWQARWIKIGCGIGCGIWTLPFRSSVVVLLVIYRDLIHVRSLPGVGSCIIMELLGSV